MSDSDSEYSEDNYEPSEQWIYRINLIAILNYILKKMVKKYVIEK